MKLCAEMLFRFQWWIEKLWKELTLGPGAFQFWVNLIKNSKIRHMNVIRRQIQENFMTDKLMNLALTRNKFITDKLIENNENIKRLMSYFLENVILFNHSSPVHPNVDLEKHWGRGNHPSNSCFLCYIMLREYIDAFCNNLVITWSYNTKLHGIITPWL